MYIKGFWVGLLALFSTFSMVFAAGGDLGTSAPSYASGSKLSPFLIEDMADFDAFCADDGYWGEGVHVKLMTDLDMSSKGTFKKSPIARDEGDFFDFSFVGTSYSGHFDGNFHSIDNLTVMVQFGYAGLFGRSERTAVIKNITLKDAYIVVGSEYCGGIVAENRGGLINNCVVSGNIGWISSPNGSYLGGICGYNTGKILDCYVDADINAIFAVGGICGYNETLGKIINCSTSQGRSINGQECVGGICGWNYIGHIYQCFNRASIHASDINAGGICGRNITGWMVGCYSTGEIWSVTENAGGICAATYGGAIKDCYAVGKIIARGEVGGICGEANHVLIQNSFWNVETTGIGQAEDDNFGAIGKTTAQMQMRSTFEEVGWDFTCGDRDTLVWQMNGYPEYVEANELTDPYENDDTQINATEIVLSDMSLNTHSISPANDTDWLWFNLDNKQKVEFIISCDEGNILKFDLYGKEGCLCGMDQYDSFYRTEKLLDPGKYYIKIVGSTTGQSHKYRLKVNRVLLGVGSGTEEDPYQVYEVKDLLQISRNQDYYDDKCYEMICDLDMTGYVFRKALIAPGYENYSHEFVYTFTGKFDGRGHKIHDFKILIDQEHQNSNDQCIGLFGVIGDGGEVRNISFIDSEILGGNFMVGTLCGVNEGYVENCSAQGRLEIYPNGGSCVGGLMGGNRNEMYRCWADVDIYGQGNILGGLSGFNDNIMNDCYSLGNVQGKYDVGGLVGNVKGITRRCYSIGHVEGVSDFNGFCGVVAEGGTNVNCFWDVQASEFGLPGDDNLGAIGKTTEEMKTMSMYTNAGWDFSDDGSAAVWLMQPLTGYPVLIDSEMLESDSYEIDNQAELASTIVLGDSGQIHSIYPIGDVDWIQFELTEPSGIVISTQTDGDTEMWLYDSAMNQLTYNNDTFWSTAAKISIKLEAGIYFIKISQFSDNKIIEQYQLALSEMKYSGGDGTIISPYIIKNADDLIELQQNTDDINCHFRQESDIHLTNHIFYSAILAPDQNLNQIGYDGRGFSGVYDGGGYHIYNVTMHPDFLSNEYIGFCGMVTSDGIIKNVHVDNLTFNTEHSAIFVGGIAGFNDGQIINCSVQGQISGAYLSIIGGLCGGQNGNISQSFADITIVCNQTDSSYLGGLCGFSGGTVSDCYALGSITGADYVGGLFGHTGGTTNNSYAAALVAGNSFVGGACGILDGGIINNSFYDVELTGLGTIGQEQNGAMGLSTAEMQSQITFNSDWDFNSVWSMPYPSGHPILRWQRTTPGDFIGSYDVDIDDLLILVDYWMSNISTPADIQGDGKVNMLDFAILSQNWHTNEN